MKKFFIALVCAALAVVTASGFTACKKKGDIEVYTPNGAPALALAYLFSLDDENYFGRDVDYDVVNAQTIQTYVTGKRPQADICILPVNIACKLLGNGDTYKMLGTVTHGNLYIMGKTEDELNDANLSEKLIGKTVGVVQLANVPGLTFQALLKDKGMQCKQLGNSDAPDADKVNLKAIQPDAVLPGETTCDYYVVPEPAATTKASKTTLSIVGDVQRLYGGEEGYPQAALVAKTSLIDSDPKFIESFTQAVEYSAQWIQTADPSYVVRLVNDELDDGEAPQFTVMNTTSEVIKNCAVRYESSAVCKQKVLDIIEKFIDINPTSAATPSDSFFYA